MDVASLAGGRPPVDPWSDPANPAGVNQDDIITTGFLHTPRHAAKLEGSLRLADVDLSGYDAVLFAGGNAAIFDFPGSPDVRRTVEAFWNSGRVVSTVCHGGAALLEARLPDGRYLVEGQEVTAFDNEEEAMAQAQIGREYLPFYLEDELPKRGATFRHVGPFQPFVVVSGGGRLITGQQNMSGQAIGRKLVKALNGGAR